MWSSNDALVVLVQELRRIDSSNWELELALQDSSVRWTCECGFRIYLVSFNLIHIIVTDPAEIANIRQKDLEWIFTNFP
jgi:hypothetical protein